MICIQALICPGSTFRLLPVVLFNLQSVIVLFHLCVSGHVNVAKQRNEGIIGVPFMIILLQWSSYYSFANTLTYYFVQLF